MNDYQRQLAALRGQKPGPPKIPYRPIELPDPTDHHEKRTSQRSEADICDKLGDWLRAQGYEIFFEVPLDNFRPDVVGFRGEETAAIEAKKEDYVGVIKQGMRLARRVDRPYVALPFGAADSAVAEQAEIERKIMLRSGGRKPVVMPGILAVGRENVRELRAPYGRPYKRMATEKLRESAERFGAERGGVPSTDQTDRNIEIYLKFLDGKSIGTLAQNYKISETAAKTAVKRIAAWRGHLVLCNGEICRVTRQDDREFFVGAHKHSEQLRYLPVVK
jgi:hypothetical protein